MIRIVNSSASLSRRKVQAVEGARFVSGATGFSLITIDLHHHSLYMMDKDGNVLHTVERTR